MIKKDKSNIRIIPKIKHSNNYKNQYDRSTHKKTVSNKNLIIGKNCVCEVIKHKPDTIKKILVTEQNFDFIADLLKDLSLNTETEIVKKEQLTELANSDSHQGFAANIEYTNFRELKEVIKELNTKDRFTILALDEISDPQNFGSIIRAAECFGVDLIIYSLNRGTSITPSLTKASVGAVAMVNLCEVHNLAQSIFKIREDTKSWIITADSGAETESIFKFEFPLKSIIVMGSEGEGVQDLIQRKADFKVAIPMMGVIDSLNVSQATSVFLGFRNRYSN